MGRVHRAYQRLAIGGEGLDRPAFQGACPSGRRQGLQGGARPRLGGTDRFWHSKRLHEFHRARRYANPAPRDRLHALLLLSAPDTRHAPEWYRTTNYRRRLVRWPREVLAEFGLIVPPEVEIRVEDSNQKCRFMVLPVRPEGTENWTEEQLAAIVTRDCMIGVALPRPGRTADVHPIHKARRPVQSSPHKGAAE